MMVRRRLSTGNYSTKLRRTVHLGYRAFGGANYPHNDWLYWHPAGFTKHLWVYLLGLFGFVWDW